MNVFVLVWVKSLILARWAIVFLRGPRARKRTLQVFFLARVTQETVDCCPAVQCRNNMQGATQEHLPMRSIQSCAGKCFLKNQVRKLPDSVGTLRLSASSHKDSTKIHNISPFPCMRNKTVRRVNTCGSLRSDVKGSANQAYAPSSWDDWR